MGTHNPLQDNQGLGPTMQAMSVIVGNLLPGAKEMLESQGCRVIENGKPIVIKYPRGTTRQELWPRTYDTRYRIVLPNGCELREIQTRDVAVRGLYIVAATVKEAPTTE